MLIYPFNLLRENIFPIFGNQISGMPVFIDLSKNNEQVDIICNTQTQKEFNSYMINEMRNNNKNYAVSAYLEDRSTLLKKYQQMIATNRVYHLGVDITLALGAVLYAPLDGEVVVSEYEEGDGEYGSMVVLKHNIENTIFYTLYGHLSKESLPTMGLKVKKGEEFSRIGDFHENGNWFHHLHLQVLTEEGYNNGWVHKGYCTEEDLKNIDKYCPNPTFLFKVS